MEYSTKMWNVIEGCSRVSAGCDNCYAIGSVCGNVRRAKKDQPNPYADLVQIKGDKWGWSGKTHLFEKKLNEPSKRTIATSYFCASMTDWYHHTISLDTLKRLFAVMNDPRCKKHNLTKRPKRMREVKQELTWAPNIWQGVTFEGISQDMLDSERKAILSRIPALQKHPAAVKFISFEPLIAPIPQDLDLSGITWAFFGGEPGDNARPMDMQWLRNGIELCKRFGVQPFVKQVGKVASNGGGERGQDASKWEDEFQPYAIESLRQVTPDVLNLPVVDAPIEVVSAPDEAADVERAWAEYKPTEEPGIALGKALYAYRETHGSKGGRSSKGAGLGKLLKELSIPRRTAYFWIDRYEIENGLKAPKAKRVAPDSSETTQLALKLIDAGYKALSSQYDLLQLRAAKSFIKTAMRQTCATLHEFEQVGSNGAVNGVVHSHLKDLQKRPICSTS
jgi:protein gp37